MQSDGRQIMLWSQFQLSFIISILGIRLQPIRWLAGCSRQAMLDMIMAGTTTGTDLGGRGREEMAEKNSKQHAVGELKLDAAYLPCHGWRTRSPVKVEYQF